MKKLISIIAVVLLVMFSLSIVSAVGPFDRKEPTEQPSVYSELNYIAFGDSITYGFDCVTDNIRVDKPYPQLIAEELKVNHHFNYGVNGATLTMGNEGRTSIISQVINASSRADIVSVLAGVNDYYSNVPLGTINDEGYSTVYGALNSLVKALKSKYSDTFIFFMTPYQCFAKIGVNAAGVELSDIAQAVKDVCAKEGIPVLDLHESGEFSEQNDPLSDGIHPTQEFFEEYTAPQITAFIKQNYRR